MAYALLDTGFHDHPKILALLDEPDALAAIGLWTLTIAWAKSQADPDKQDTAGHIPLSMIRRLGGDERLAGLLTKVGLWEQNGTGWIIHDFAERQQLEVWRVRRLMGKRGGRTPNNRRSEPSANHEANQNETMRLSQYSTRQDKTDTGGAGDDEQLPLGLPKCRALVASGRQCRNDPKPGSDYCGTHEPRTKPDSPDFAAFWRAYPRKTAKQGALAAWDTALKRGMEIPTVIAAAERYAADPNRKPEFTCLPATWLNQGRWDDESENSNPNNDWWLGS